MTLLSDILGGWLIVAFPAACLIGAWIASADHNSPDDRRVGVRPSGDQPALGLSPSSPAGRGPAPTNFSATRPTGQGFGPTTTVDTRSLTGLRRDPQ